MKYLFIAVGLLLLTSCSSWGKSEFEELSEMARKEVKKTCDEVGGTLATGVEITYTLFGTEVTAGYYCINSSTPTELIR